MTEAFKIFPMNGGKLNKCFFLIDKDADKFVSHLLVVKESFSNHRRKVVGFPRTGDIFYLSSFGTMSDYRRKGYGRKLMNFVKENTKGQFIYLIVHSPSERIITDKQLVKLYESFGFKVHEKKDEYKDYTWMILDNR